MQIEQKTFPSFLFIIYYHLFYLMWYCDTSAHGSKPYISVLSTCRLFMTVVSWSACKGTPVSNEQKTYLVARWFCQHPHIGLNHRFSPQLFPNKNNIRMISFRQNSLTFEVFWIMSPNFEHYFPYFPWFFSKANENPSNHNDLYRLPSQKDSDLYH